ncbi:Hypothetical protein A7982_04539 [Minicystis rosea]|nr:Hypothetical protein A7982_04539 [Minicystis rosea]
MTKRDIPIDAPRRYPEETRGYGPCKARDVRRLSTTFLGSFSLAVLACAPSVETTPSGGAGGGTSIGGAGGGTTVGGAGGGTTTSTGGAGGAAITDAPWSRRFGTPDLATEVFTGGVAGDDGVFAVTQESAKNDDNTWHDVSPRHLLRFDPLGNVVSDWSIDRLGRVAVAPDQSLIVTFDIIGGSSTDFLGKPVSCEADWCTGIARVDANGTPVWIRTLEANGAQAGVTTDQLRIAENGRIVMTGLFNAKLDIGTSSLDSGPTTGLFVAELTPDGAPAWARAIRFFYSGGSQGWFYLRMATSSAGDVVIGGTSEAPIDFGDGVMLPVSTQSGFFARYDASGTVVQRGSIPAPQNGEPITVAIDTMGNTTIAAWSRGAFDLDGTTLGAPGETRLHHIKLDSNGALLGSQVLIDGEDGLGSLAMAIDATNQTWLCTTLSTPLTVGGAALTPVSTSDILLLKLDPSGNVLSRRQFGTTGRSGCIGVRLGPTGVPVLAGMTTGSIDFGQGLLQTTGLRDGLIAKLGPSDTL